MTTIMRWWELWGSGDARSEPAPVLDKNLIHQLVNSYYNNYSSSLLDDLIILKSGSEEKGH